MDRRAIQGIFLHRITAAVWDSTSIWYYWLLLMSTQILHSYVIQCDERHHLSTAYYVSGTSPGALYTLSHLLLKQLCKVGIIFAILQSWKQIQICNLLQVTQLFKQRTIWFSKSMLSWLHRQDSACFIAKLGINLGSSLWVQDKTEEAAWDFDVAGVASGSRREECQSFL